MALAPIKADAAAIIQQPVRNVTENQQPGGSLYPAEKVVPTSSFTLKSVVINYSEALSSQAITTMDILSATGFTLSHCTVSSAILSEGTRYDCAPITMSAGVTYYLMHGDNNHDFYFRGTTRDQTTTFEAGGVTLGGTFTSNATRGLAMRDWQFAMCDSTECQEGLGFTTFDATTSAFWGQYSATDTLDALNASCNQIDNIFGSAFCIAGAYLFVPDPSVLQQYGDLGFVFQGKKPFSYFYQVKDLYGSLASSTNSLPTFQYDLHSVDPATSTAMGAILPSFSVLSSTTVTRFMPAGSLDTLLALAAIALYLTLAADMFFTIRYLIRT